MHHGDFWQAAFATLHLTIQTDMVLRGVYARSPGCCLFMCRFSFCLLCVLVLWVGGTQAETIKQFLPARLITAVDAFMQTGTGLENGQTRDPRTVVRAELC
jgi:hypothetical protein